MEKLNNDNIIHQHDSFIVVDENQQQKYQFVIVMDYCCNGNLENFMKNNKNINEAVKNRWMLQILLAVVYSHDNDIIHGDLKLENCLLDSNLNILLSDFGLAKQNLNKDDQYDQGTLEYCAPEILKGGQHTKSSDVWSLGCMWYKIITNTLPFHSNNIQSIIDNITNCKFKEIQQQQHLSYGKIISKLFELDVSKRIVSSDILLDLAKELKVFHYDLPLRITLNNQFSLNQYSDLIGNGSFGSCYKCINLSNGEQDVIKMYHIIDINEDIQIQYEKECKILEVFNHDNIAKGITHFQCEFLNQNHYCIVMLYYKNQDLQKIVKQIQKIDVSVKEKWMLQVLDAISFLHKNNIIHRDIKLENCFLDDNYNVKLGDFGTIKNMKGTIAKFTAAVGTYETMAPEVIKGLPYGAPADVWSMGCVWYQIITGVGPFDNCSMNQIVDAKYEKINARQLSKYQDCIYQMLQIDVSFRPSAQQVVETFQKLNTKEECNVNYLDSQSSVPSNNVLEQTEMNTTYTTNENITNINFQTQNKKKKQKLIVVLVIIALVLLCGTLACLLFLLLDNNSSKCNQCQLGNLQNISINSWKQKASQQWIWQNSSQSYNNSMIFVNSLQQIQGKLSIFYNYQSFQNIQITYIETEQVSDLNISLLQEQTTNSVLCCISIIMQQINIDNTSQIQLISQINKNSSLNYVDINCSFLNTSQGSFFIIALYLNSSLLTSKVLNILGNFISQDSSSIFVGSSNLCQIINISNTSFQIDYWNTQNWCSLFEIWDNSSTLCILNLFISAGSLQNFCQNLVIDDAQFGGSYNSTLIEFSNCSLEGYFNLSSNNIEIFGGYINSAILIGEVQNMILHVNNCNFSGEGIYVPCTGYSNGQIAFVFCSFSPVQISLINISINCTLNSTGPVDEFVSIIWACNTHENFSVSNTEMNFSLIVQNGECYNGLTMIVSSGGFNTNNILILNNLNCCGQIISGQQAFSVGNVQVGTQNGTAKLNIQNTQFSINCNNGSNAIGIIGQVFSANKSAIIFIDNSTFQSEIEVLSTMQACSNLGVIQSANFSVSSINNSEYQSNIQLYNVQSSENGIICGVIDNVNMTISSCNISGLVNLSGLSCGIVAGLADNASLQIMDLQIDNLTIAVNTIQTGLLIGQIINGNVAANNITFNIKYQSTDNISPVGYCCMLGSQGCYVDNQSLDGRFTKTGNVGCQ